MNWKTIGAAFLVTLGLFIIVALLILLILKAPSWLILVIGFSVVFILIYNSMTKYDDFDNPDDCNED